MNRLRVHLGRFRRNERGAVAWLMCCGAVPMLLLLFYLTNTTKNIHEKSRTQDAADAIALVHATEAARALNTMSMNNVSLTQAFAAGTTSGALNDVAIFQAALSGLGSAAAAGYGAKICKKWKKIPKIGAALFAACYIPNGTLAADAAYNAARAGLVLWNYDPHGAYTNAKNAALDLDAMNKEIVNKFPKRVGESASVAAKSAKVTDIYFDKNCAYGQASSCSNSNKRQGMELPLDRNTTKSVLGFCAAMHFGSLGVKLDLPTKVIPPVAVTLANGSYLRRKFPTGKGPMYGGKGKKTHLRDYINEETSIGYIIHDYYRMARRKQLVDGILALPFVGFNAVKVVTGMAKDVFKGGDGDVPSEVLEAIGTMYDVPIGTSLEKKFKLNYPYKQSDDDNFYTDVVDFRIGTKCIGGAIPGVTQVLNSLSSVPMPFSTMPDFDTYYPKGVSFPPLPGPPSLDDFDDGFKPLGFTYRKPNKRWAPKLYKDPTKGFYAYSQAITFNPDEIGIYSQNWQARLMKADRIEIPGPVADRMQSKAGGDFGTLASNLKKVKDLTGWKQVNAK